MPLPHDPGPHWGEVGIHGLHRQREWDTVATVEVPEAAGDEIRFVLLADGSVQVEAGDADADRFRPAVTLTPPLRVWAVRRGGATWAVGARRIETVELPDGPSGDEVELAWDGSERTVRIDGVPTLEGVPELERLAASRHRTYVARATRLRGTVWEASISPL